MEGAETNPGTQVMGLCDALREQPQKAPPHINVQILPYRLNKQTADDNAEAFLHTFETTAMAAGWPRTQWVMILGPYLIGPAQVLLKTLSLAEVNNYDKVKAAILDRYEIRNPTTAVPCLEIQSR